MDELLKNIEEIGEVIEYGFEVDTFKYVIGERKISDFETIKKIAEIQKNHFQHFTYLKKMVMNESNLIVEVTSKPKP